MFRSALCSGGRRRRPDRDLGQEIARPHFSGVTSISVACSPPLEPQMPLSA